MKLEVIEVQACATSASAFSRPPQAEDLPPEASPYQGCLLGSASVLLLILIYIFVQFAVVALTFAFGGRYERYTAANLLLGTIAFQLAQKAFTGEIRGTALLVVDVGMFIAAGWLFWRHRAVWSGAFATIQAVAIPLDFIAHFQPGRPGRDVLIGIWWVNSVLVYLALAILVLAVLRRAFGPPYPLNRKETQAAAAAPSRAA